MIFPKPLSAQKEDSKEYVVIDVAIQDSLLIKNASIQFEVNKNDINSAFTKGTNFYKFDIESTNTRIRLPLPDSICYGRIIYNVNGKSHWFKPSNNLFIFQPGDSIGLSLSSNGVAFHGRGAEKFNCLNDIYMEKIYSVSAKAEVFYHQQDFEAMLDAEKEQQDSLYSVQVNILNKYKSGIDPAVHSIIQADCWGKYNYNLIGLLLIKSTSNGERTIYNDAVEKAYIKYFGDFNDQKFSEDVQAKSYHYADFLYSKESFATMFFHSPRVGFYNYRYTFKELYESMNSNFTGIIRDKLVLLALYHKLNIIPDAVTFLKTVPENMGNNRFREAILTLIKSHSGNAFPFELMDEDRKVYKLSDFKEKLIIMDFWFTGCLACIQLAEQMKPIVESYKDNPNIVFVTVSIDKKREVWKRSLKEEKYSSVHHINLYTGGLGNKHPLIKHYNIIGYPTMLVISKDGKFVTSAPPRPKEKAPESVNAFKSFLEQYL